MNDIQPITSKPAVKARLEEVRIRPNEPGAYGSATVYLFNEDGVQVDSLTHNGLTKEQLDAWAEDDNVIVEIVLSALGITMKA